MLGMPSFSLSQQNYITQVLMIHDRWSLCSFLIGDHDMQQKVVWFTPRGLKSLSE